MLSHFLRRSTAILLAALGLAGCRAVPTPLEDVVAYDVEPWRTVLAAGVKNGLVDYRAVAEHHEADLDRYLDAVARFGPRTAPGQFPTEADELAYYINAYNALMIRRWLDAGAGAEDGTQRSVNLLWFLTDHWRVDNRWTSLNTLEQKTIRRGYDDPRFHFALVCGAVSCPPLLDEPFEGPRLDEQFEAMGRRWLREEQDGFRLDADGSARMSMIFMWYFDDFREMGEMPGVLERYLDPDDPRLPAALASFDEGTAEWQPYFWTINDVSTVVEGQPVPATP